MLEDEKKLQEQEQLIEVLKFTPRTYKVRLWGYGGEYVMGTVSREIYDYFRERRLSVEDFAWNYDYAEENDIPEEMWPFTPGSWHECDNMGGLVQFFFGKPHPFFLLLEFGFDSPW